MSTVKLPVPQLFAEQTPAQVHVNRIASIIVLPENHTLAYVDYGLERVRFSFYTEDPKITCPALERNSDDDEDSDTIYDLEVEDFIRNNCHSCKYYFDEREVESEDEDGNKITSVVYSACCCYSNGFNDMAESSDGCIAGHTLPEYHDSDEDDENVRETTTHVYRGRKCWDKTNVSSAPLYFSISYVDQYRYDLYEIWCGVGFAKKIPAFESNEYMYLLSPMWRALNTYSDAPSRVCWGNDYSAPTSANIDSLYGLYYGGVFNDDLEQFDDYERSIEKCNELITNVSECVEQMLRSDDLEEYAEVVQELKGGCNDADYLLNNDPNRCIVSCDAWDKKAHALLVVDKTVSTELFYKLYISGIPSPVQEVLTKPLAVYPLYRHRYVNPQNPEQYVDGYVTQPNSSGIAWFFVQDYNVIANVNDESDIDHLEREEYNKFYQVIHRNNCTENLALSFGQIQL